MSPILGYAVCCLAAVAAGAICTANIRLAHARRLRDSAWKMCTQAKVELDANRQALEDVRRETARARTLLRFATDRLNEVTRRTT